MHVRHPHYWSVMLCLALLLGAFVGTALAQVAPATAGVDWKGILTVAVNSVLVLAVVAGINSFLPMLRIQYPWLVPILATAVGPIVGLLQTYLAAKIGIQVDFSPIVAALAGATATAIHQVGVNQPTVARMMKRPG